MKVKRKGSKGAWLHAPRARRYGLATPKSGWSGVKHWEPSQHKRMILTVFICLLALGVGGWVIDPTNGLFHSTMSCAPDTQKPGAPCQDPSQILWQATDTGGLSDFNVYSGSGSVLYTAPCSTIAGTSCMTLAATSTQSVEAVSKTAIGELSTASKSLLAFHVSWALGSIGGITPGVEPQWGYYLTTNSTLPQNSAFSNPNGAWYDPIFDPSVTFAQTYFCFSSCNTNTPHMASTTYALRTLGQSHTLNSEKNGCSQSGSAFLCNNILTDPASNFNFDGSEYLNYTGVVNGSSCTVSGTPGVIGPAPGCSWNLNQPLTGQAVSTFWISTQTLPWFALQSQQYYIGFFETANVGSSIQFTFQGGTSGNMDVFTFTPATAGPTIDTGGFFGPVIRALINIGVFVLNAILLFLGFIVQAIRVGLNAVGQFAGWGNIGDNFITDLNNLGNLFAQAGNVLGWLVNGVSLFVQYIAVIGNGFNSWMTNVCCGSNSFFGPGVTFSGFIFTFFGYLVTFGPLPIVTFDFVFFLLMTGSDGLGGFASWWQWNKWMVFLFIQAGITLVEILVGGGGWLLSHIPTISSHLPPRFVESFSAQTGQGIGSAPAFRGFQTVKGKFGGTEHGGSIGFGAIGNLAPDSLLLWMGGLFIFWQYLGSSISPLPSMLTGLTTGCAPRACINSGVSAITPLLGLWIMMFCFLFFDYIATSVGFGLVNSAVDDGGVKLGFSKSTRKLVGRFGKKAKRFVGEAMDAKGVKEMGKQMKAETRKEIHAVQITTSKAVARQGIGLKTGKVNAQQRFRQLIKRSKQGRQHP